MKKLDIFPHIFPKAYFDKMVEVDPEQGRGAALDAKFPCSTIWIARLRMMEEFGPDYQQILTLSMPAIEYVAPPETSPDLAKLANDGMAEIVAKHPEPLPRLRGLRADEQRQGGASTRSAARSKSWARAASRS